MKRQNITPAVGIALCLAVTILGGLHSVRERQATQLEIKPALPEITSATQPMGLDEIHLRIKKVFDSTMPGHYMLYMDKEASTLTLDMWVDGYNASTANAALHSREYLNKWNANLEDGRTLCAQMQQLASDHGHPELTIILRTVNCDDTGQIFATFERGVLTYDVVADTPPGEEVPDPASRVLPTVTAGEIHDYVVNTASAVFHLPSCSAAGQIAAYNRAVVPGDRADLIAQGYTPCGRCNP